MQQPYLGYVEGQKKKTWIAPKIWLKVCCFDFTRQYFTITYVKASHSPLRQVSNEKTHNIGLHLWNNAQRLKIEQNDIREGPSGAMACSGMRLYGEQLIQYKNSDPSQNQMIECVQSYFKKHGYLKYVNNLLRCVTNAGGNKSNTIDLGRYSWCNLCVTTSNYGNEPHLDMGDNCQGITIWHESNPGSRNAKKKKNIDNWYFLFPDMKVLYKGEWRKGAAIPLQHGTIITWDARLLRHCTAYPEVKPGNHAFGTYFGIQDKYINYLRAVLAKKQTSKMQTNKLLTVTSSGAFKVETMDDAKPSARTRSAKRPCRR